MRVRASLLGVALALAPAALAGGTVGTPGPDTLVGTPAADRLAGGAGDDELYGGGGDDSLDGGLGADHLYGGDGDDRLVGGPWRDAPARAAVFHRERLLGGAGDDVLVSHLPASVVSGGPGDDRIDVRGPARGCGRTLSSGDTCSVYVLAGDGDDTIDALDGNPDVVQCGPGVDAARLDRRDRTDGACERVGH